MQRSSGAPGGSTPVTIPAGRWTLEGDFAMPAAASGLVLFAHGSGSSRHSPRNRLVAGALREAGLATLLIDLLTAAEESAEAATGHLRFNIGLLAERLVAVTDWLPALAEARRLPVGYFGASTGAAAALAAAAQRPSAARAIVSRGGRPDLAPEALPLVTAPTLLVVGENDAAVLALNRRALSALRAEKALEIVPQASHLFEEPGALEQVARLAAGWFLRHLPTAERARQGP